MPSYRGNTRILRRRKLARVSTRRIGRVENLEDRRLLAVLTVNSANDDGPGTLRQAILQSNASSEKDQIVFSLPGAAPKITLATALPLITNPVVIDATTQPGYAGQPLVRIDGSQLGDGVDAGFSLQAGASTVRGFALTNFDTAIFVTGPGANTIEGNVLGASSAESQADGNTLTGVHIVDSPNNTIGGQSPSSRNIISGNGEYGVRIDGVPSQGNRIQGNYIGTDAAGTIAVPNAINGIIISSGANHNLVGTDGDGTADALEGNVVSGNTQSGIQFYESTDNIVAGNFLGTNFDGSAALPNGDSGITLATSKTKYNRIGTNGDGVSDAVERNVMSGNAVAGLTISNGSENIIAGNFIGTSLSGLAALKNGSSGVRLINSARLNRIGTNGDGRFDSAERNIISGNGTDGITISSSHANTVAGNLIGVSASGNAAIANGHSGVAIVSGATGNIIGTNDDGANDVAERNIISGNVGDGVAIQNSHFNRVAGNYIGLNGDGTAAIANASGVSLNDSVLNVVGADGSSRSGSSARNIISGGRGNGVLISGSSSVANSIGGNLIGLSADGAKAMPNALSGVAITGSGEGNSIGGDRPEQQNVISGNGQYGIYLAGQSHGTTILGNRIGLASAGTTPLGNALAGIVIDDAYDNAVGSDTAQAANEIAYNGPKGIVVTSATATNNRFERNLIYGHSLVGIDLGNDGATLNDASDADTGPNGLQNFPTIQSVASAAGKTQVAGTLAGDSGTTYLLRFYAKHGNGNLIQDMEYLGSKEVTAQSTGPLNWTVELPASVATDRSVIATARSSVVGTSEFSPPYNVVAPSWYNTANPLDVNANGSVSPLDALLIINVLNSSGSVPVSQLSPPTDGSKTYVDTNHDDFLSPIDALLVINYLNAAAGNSEGEASPVPSGQSAQGSLDATSLDASSVDQVFFDVGDRLRKLWV